MTTQAASGGAYRTHLKGDVSLRSFFRAVLPLVVGLWIFSGGFVLIEPSPYELTFVLAFPVMLLAGVRFYRRTAPILMLLVLFVPFALIAAFQPKHVTLSSALLFQFVTIFLWLTSYMGANYVAELPHRSMKVIMAAYTAVAVLVALIGTFAYLGVLPGADIFLRYGRAKATFKDPNVFGPFLILPAMFALQKVLLAHKTRAIMGGIVYVILFVGVFVSFSRGAWGHFALSSLLVFAAVFVWEARTKDKVRMVALAIIGVVGLFALLAVLLSIDSVRDLFLTRFSLEQNYDTGATGRFGRQLYAFNLALTHPWGIGPYEFRELRIPEEPHDLYVHAILVYGWVGGFAFLSLIFATLWRGFTTILRPSPNRLLMIPVMAVYVPLIIEAAIIDSDHWRHLYLVIALIWGISANYRKTSAAQQTREGQLI